MLIPRGVIASIHTKTCSASKPIIAFRQASMFLKTKQVVLDSCSSKRMQAEGKHNALDQSLQASTDPEASKQYSNSFLQIMRTNQSST
jgi:hypothetical protein